MLPTLIVGCGNSSTEIGNPNTDVDANPGTPDGSPSPPRPNWFLASKGTLNDVVVDMAVDSEGCTVIVGYFESRKLELGGRSVFAGESDLDPEIDAFIAKISNTGEVMWMKAFGSRPTANNVFFDGFSGVAIDSHNNIVAVGSFSSTSISIGGTQLTGGGSMIAKFDPAGEVVWATSTTVPSLSAAYDVAIAQQDNILIAGSGQLGYVAIVAKLSPEGSLVWSHSGTSISEGTYFPAQATLIAVDSDDSIRVAGTFMGIQFNLSTATAFNEDEASGFETEESSDIFFAKFSASGEPLWMRNLGAEKTFLAEDTPISLVMGNDGEAFLSAQIAFSVITLPNRVVEPSDFDFGLVSKWDTNGNLVWGDGVHAGGCSSAYARRTNNLAISCTYTEPSEFRGSPLTMQSYANAKFLIAKLSPGAATDLAAIHKSDGNFGGPSQQLAGKILMDGDNQVVFTGVFSSDTWTLANHSATNTTPNTGMTPRFDFVVSRMPL